MKKVRLDVLLTEQGFAPSREKAKAIIMSGVVFVNGQREDKAGSCFDPTDLKIEVRGQTLKYVSRGGLKLEKAFATWQLQVEDLVCLDIGCSTGGFTDVCLQNGAAKVYSVDVGHGQLAWSLRQDPRVVVMEQTNFRYLEPKDLPEMMGFAATDVSFISLTKILIPARNLLEPGAQMVCLIKPQFEAGREKVGKHGVVREAETHREVIGSITDYADMIGFEVLGLDYSPITGPEGNVEFLLLLEKRAEIPEEILALSEKEAEEKLRQIRADGSGLSGREDWEHRIRGIVDLAHEHF